MWNDVLLLMFQLVGSTTKPSNVSKFTNVKVNLFLSTP